jgi:hypothetical protein
MITPRYSSASEPAARSEPTAEPQRVSPAAGFLAQPSCGRRRGAYRRAYRRAQRYFD